MESEGEHKEEVRDEAAIIDQILAELDAEGVGITIGIVPELEMGHWQVNGISFLIKDSLMQGAMDNGREVQTIWVDALVKTADTEAFMKLIQSHFAEGGYLTFTRGKTTREVSLSKLAYASSTRGYYMRMDVHPKGSEPRDKNLEERLLKVKDIERYVDGKGGSIKGMRSYFQ